VRPAPLLLAAVLTLSACAGEVADPGAEPTPVQTTQPEPVASGPTCPPAKDVPDKKWPKDIPDVVPRPAGLKVQRVDESSGGNVVQVRTVVPMSIRESLVWIVRELPKAGFTLGRGDAEATEVDAPFQRGPGLRGLIRVFITDQECQTLWVYAVVRQTNAPYDISYTPPPSSTPLPFG
jgi:hypothetical protein